VNSARRGLARRRSAVFRWIGVLAEERSSE
jgi:hypothetical protein